MSKPEQSTLTNKIMSDEEFFKLSADEQKDLCKWIYIAMVKDEGDHVKVLKYEKKPIESYNELKYQIAVMNISDDVNNGSSKSNDSDDNEDNETKQEFKTIAEYDTIYSIMGGNVIDSGEGHFVITFMSMYELDDEGINERANKRFQMDPETFRLGFSIDHQGGIIKHS
jgi:hypothetical protein